MVGVSKSSARLRPHHVWQPAARPDGAFFDGASGPPEELERREEAGRLRELLEQLPSMQREVIRARIYEGKRFREIAERMGCPLNTTLARMHQGLKRLRTLWEQQHA